MLRYNNQVGFSKPVDYFRPLTVDVSVEYELPKEVAPPPGSAPLLIIHPSAYYRSKINGVSPSKPVKVIPESSSSSSSTYYLRSSSTNTNSSTGVNGAGLSNQHIYSTSSTNNHGLVGGSSKSVRYGNPSSSINSSSISRSRSMTMGQGGSNGGGDSHTRGSISIVNCPYGKCDECASSSSSGCGRTTTTSTTITNSSSSSARVTNGVKKLGFHRQPAQQDGPGGIYLEDPFNYYSQHHSSTTSNTMRAESNSKNHLQHHQQHLLLQQQHQNIISSSASGSNNGLRSSSNPPNSSVTSNTTSSANGMIDCVVGGSSNNNNNNNRSSNNASTSTSNKRLRMMSQQQNMHNNQIQISSSAEPLNLAVAPQVAAHHLHLQQIQQQQHHPLSPSSIYLNQRSALYKQHQHQQQQLQHRNSLGINNSSSSNGLLSNSSSSTNSSNILQMINSYSRGSYRSALNNPYINTLSTSNTNGVSLQTAGRFLKDGPIPVDKGSGSDSGVCSENDSDVSPPMAPYHSNSNNLSRRSILSQELPSSGCYCCCCPTTSDSSSSRKSNGGKVKSSSSAKSSSRNTTTSTYTSRDRSNNINSNSSGSGVTNYTGIGSSAYASMVIQESQLGNMLISCDSPMAGGNSPMDSSSPATYRRKWFVGNGVSGGDTSSLGRWFQV